ncbi:MAG: PEP-CTERM sorting domain-containing protein, partial [Planctomycetota bacterium]
GTLVANVNGNGIYRPGNSDGTVGTLNVDNSATSSISSARLEVDLFDQNVNDVLAFGDNLFANDLDIAVDLAGGFLPNPGDDFTVLTSGGSLTASSPDAFEVAGLPGLLFTTLVTSSDLILTADNAIDGDFNYDGTVDLADFGILRAGFGSGDEYVLGDANQDGTVDLADFGILRANFGSSVTPSDLAMMDAWALTAVPEPTVALGLAGLGGLMLRRRRA